jgi:hypothetical protein
VEKILAELRQERLEIEQVILALEQEPRKQGRRGRPPSWPGIANHEPEPPRPGASVALPRTRRTRSCDAYGKKTSGAA